MTACKIDHGAEGFPKFLCRVCCPQLIPTAEQRAAHVATERAAAFVKRKESERQRELASALGRVASITKRGEPWEHTVEGKIVKSLRAKIVRLQQETNT